MTRLAIVIRMLPFAFALASCSNSLSFGISATPTQPTRALTVFAAASLTESFTKLAMIFEDQNPDVQVTLNFAGSQQLAEQLAQGARADVFASASQKYMVTAIENGIANDDEAKVFAQNHLVVIAPILNPAGISSYRDVAKPGVKLVLADAAVPAGAYSLAFLRAADIETEALANVVSYEENVKAVLTKVLLGEADAGIVYVSDINAEVGAGLASFAIPLGLNQTADYLITPLITAPNPDLAQAFIAFVFSEEGQAILEGTHFISVE